MDARKRVIESFTVPTLGVHNPEERDDVFQSPPCVVCGDAATGIHFGADACAACSAFFRRTVSVKRDFSCIGDGVKPCTNLKGAF